MGLTMSSKSRHELLLALRPRYAIALVGEKKHLLDSFIAATGYDRKYAITLLRNGKNEKNGKRNRKRKYGDDVVEALVFVWNAANRVCSKRLVPFLPTLVESLERFEHLNIADPVKEQLLSLSPATMDRLLTHERRKYGKGKCTTTAGHLIKAHIPIRTFADWSDVVPGFLEADLVAHCGEVARGKYLNTLTMTDVATGWTEPYALMGKGEEEVLAAIEDIKKILPFTLQGIDTDNGGEFINYQLAAWCARNGVTFTRSREYRKNDQCHVEEKNGSIVRKFIGYDRYDSIESWELLTQLYGTARYYINYFQPSAKLVSKERDGARVRKRYDKAKTPCERLLASPLIPEEQKERLRELFRRLDPLLLLQEIERYQLELEKTSVNAGAIVREQYSETAISEKQEADVTDSKPAVSPPATSSRRRPKKARTDLVSSPKGSPLSSVSTEPAEFTEAPALAYEPRKPIANLSTLIDGFVNDHLRKRRLSDNTVLSYGDSLRLLHQFAQRHLGKDAAVLRLADLSAPLVKAFLDDMENRGISTSSRNLRLTTIHSFCRYLNTEVPVVPSSVTAILKLRGEDYTRPAVEFLSTPQISALLNAPDRSTWSGRRDHAFMTIALETGLMISEMVKLTRKNVKELETGVHITLTTKGRQTRLIPLTEQAVAVLDAWLQEPVRRNAQTLFPNARGGCLTDDGVRHILNVQIGTASESCSSLEEKRFTPFILRHTRAMQLVQSGMPKEKIAYWLGLNVESLHIYFNLDLALRKRAIKEKKDFK